MTSTYSAADLAHDILSHTRRNGVPPVSLPLHPDDFASLVADLKASNIFGAVFLSEDTPTSVGSLMYSGVLVFSAHAPDTPQP